jgi:hypothetical protein
MKNILVGSTFAVLAAAGVSPLAAQDARVGEPVTSGHGSVYVQPYVGYIRFGQLADLGSGRDFSNENGALYGVQAGYSFTPNVALVGNLGYTKSKFQIKDTGGDASVNSSGDIGLFLYDANLQLKLPFVANRIGSNVAPFVQAGVGQTKYTADSDDLNGKGTTSTTFNVGLGTDIQLRRGLGLRLMAKDYITSLDWRKMSDVPDELQNGKDNNVANNLAFSVGLNLGF